MKISTPHGFATIVALWFLALAAHAQTFTTIKSFGVLSNISGTSPTSRLVQGTDGTLYGTAPYHEGTVSGTVFKLQPDGSGFTLLKPFTNVLEGRNPGGLVLSGNMLFGTTEFGGASGSGTVFRMNTDGSGYTVLKHFGTEFFATDGMNPGAGLTLVNGVLYGATLQGGNYSWGTIFRINTNGTGFTNLIHFTYNSPRTLYADMVVSDNVIYGMAAFGGSAGSGALIRLRTDGSDYAVLKEFTGPDGSYPNFVVLSGSTLYGTTYSGGASNNGVLFKINTNGTSFTVLRHFDSTNAIGPLGVTLSGNVLYGITSRGGSRDNGTIYQVNTNGSGFIVLKSFIGPEGARPEGQLTLNGNALFGVTFNGGNAGVGTLFKINTDGTGHTILKHFGYSDGVGPSGLALSGSTFYGTTGGGGVFGKGTVYRVNMDGSGYAVLKSFTGSDGGNPDTGVIESGGVLYGTTREGGSSDYGTLFKLSTNGSGFTVLQNFVGTNGAAPAAKVLLMGNVLFGTTESGGDFDQGTLFRVNTDGTGFAVIKHFTETEGSRPLGRLIESGGMLYGTASGGFAYGIVFRIKPDGSEFTVLKDLTTEFANPYAGLTLSDGVLFGTSYTGWWGGELFKINPDGSSFEILKKFTTDGGVSPKAEVVVMGGKIYGTTSSGGISNNGTIFRLNTDGSGYRVLHHFMESVSVGGLLLSNQVLYGTTDSGGTLGEGTIFALDLSTIPTPVVRYVNVNNATPSPPFTNWATAAVSIQDALGISSPDDRLIVTNGTYRVGGKDVAGTPNRIVVTNYVSVESVNGPRVTILDGSGLMRCAYVANECRLAGFTLTNGVADGGGGVIGEKLDNTGQSPGSIVTNCVLVGNSASSVGGAAFRATLIDCALTGNTAAVQGGGAQDCILNRCILRSNSAARGGGASQCVLYNCLVANNSGAGVADCSLLHCTISGNSGGGALAGSLANSICYFNTPTNLDENAYPYGVCTTPSPLNGGEGVLTNAPLFVNAAAGNFRLLSNSPCINVGSNDFLVGNTEIITRDLDGRPRLVGGTLDLGAYEFQPGVSADFIDWLSRYGLPTDGSADFTDADNDHMNNWQEYSAGTIPTDAASGLRMLNPSKNVLGVTVTWQSVSGRSYFLERATILGSLPSFTLMTSNIVGQPGTTSFVDTTAVGAGPFFYRVGIRP